MNAPLPESPLVELVRRVRAPSLPALVVAHRGDSQNAPENTLAAFQAAIAAGAPVIELDVRQAATGELVVIHDEKVDRTTDGQGEVARLPLAALRELSAGAWFAPEFAGERLPTLDETLDLCRGRAVPLIELKLKVRHAPEACERIAAALSRHGVEDQAAVICKELKQVELLHRLSPRTSLSYLTFTKGQALAASRIPGVGGVDIYWKSLSLALVRALREARTFITPWTVNRARDMERLLELGVEAIITDCPVLLADRIEGFEFARADELAERFLRGELGDVDLEQELEGDAPAEVSARYSSDSDVDLELEWPEEPPALD
ncbi:MAG: glycerophosphodiester phosphodiesterase [Planctomycetota bacterium]